MVVVRPMGIYLFDFFCSKFQFYAGTLSFLYIYFLYLDLYVLGDDACLSYKPSIDESCSTFKLRVRLAHCEMGFSPPVIYSKNVLTAPRPYFFSGSFVFFMSCVCNAFTILHCCRLVT